MNERYRIHAELGDAFICVAPNELRLYVCDYQACLEVLRRSRDFRRDVEKMSILNVYGKNVATTDGHEWTRFRKVTAATFTEKLNELVWDQTLTQAHGMLRYWASTSSKITRTTSKDCKTLTLNVLAGALFSRVYPFKSSTKIDSKTRAIPIDTASQYRDSLSIIQKKIFLILMFGHRLLGLRFMPYEWQRAGQAVVNFRTYILGLIADKRRASGDKNRKKRDLISSLVRASDSGRAKSATASLHQTQSGALTEDEIVSNIFIYAFAGNDTTASTLAHALMHLAANPDVQAWIRSEIQYHLTEDAISEWEYSRFPKLKRCLAVILETLRTCNPVGKLLKITGSASRSLNIGARLVELPPHTTVVLNLSALHTHPEYWGDDAMTWRPSRWIASSEGARMEDEVLLLDKFPEFFGWAHGQRACPGKRFSQVELVAELAVLFRNHCVEPFPEANESLRDARRRTSHMGNEIAFRLVHEIRHPERIGLRWKRLEHI